MQAKKIKRGYDATRRRASSDERRGRILQTARNLFGHYGYGATSIERIAGEAGVAVPTVYAMYRSKRAMLFALLDQADAQADVAGLLGLARYCGRPTQATAPAGFLYVPLLRAGGRHCRDRTRRRLYERRPSGLVAGRRGAATPRPKASDRRVGPRWSTSQEPHREGGAGYPVGHDGSRPLSAFCCGPQVVRRPL